MAINDRRLRYFVKVAEVGSMTKAAALLHVGQPALGLQIRQLEEGLGVSLLERHSRGVSLTPAGRLLYERARQILSLIQDATVDVSAFGREKRQTLTLGVTPSIMNLVGPEILVAAQRFIPNIFLSLVEEPSFVLADGIDRAEIDLALTYRTSESAEREDTTLIIEELLLVVNPKDAPANDVVPFRQAVAMDLVLIHQRDMIRQMVEAEANRQSVPLKVVYEVQSFQATRQVILSGLAAGIMPFGVVAPELRSGELVSRRIVEPQLHRRLYLSWPPGEARLAKDTRVAKFINWVVDRLAEALGPYGKKAAAPGSLLQSKAEDSVGADH